MKILFDITQVRSGLNNKDLKEDIVYIDELLDEAIYMEDVEGEHIEEIPDYLDEIDRLEGISHKHENMAVLNKVTNEMVDSWEATANAPTKISELENDSDFVTKQYIDEELTKKPTEIILVSPNGTKFSLNIDEYGALNTTEVI